jgi:hypothetical protein
MAAVVSSEDTSVITSTTLALHLQLTKHSVRRGMYSQQHVKLYKTYIISSVYFNLIYFHNKAQIYIKFNSVVLLSVRCVERCKESHSYPKRRRRRPYNTFKWDKNQGEKYLLMDFATLLRPS